VPDTVAESLSQIRQLAALLQRQEQGEALIARIEEAIARARPAPGARILTAAVYQPGGMSAGAGTVISELMEIAGLHNVAVDYGIEDYRPLPLEQLISAPPQILLVGETTRGAPTHAERVVHHRALRALQSRMLRESFPARLIYCSGPTMINALDALVAAREHSR
jgi:iron complex transport system substrate-binding protein